MSDISARRAAEAYQRSSERDPRLGFAILVVFVFALAGLLVWLTYR